MSRTLVGLLGLLIPQMPAHPAVAQSTERAILQLVVNQVEHREVLVHLRTGDVLIRVRDLEQAGLRGFAGQRQEIQGETYVSLGSLAPGITYQLDEGTLVLRLTVYPSLLGSTVRDLEPPRPSDLTYRADPSAFLNYAFNWIDFDHTTAFLESGLSLKGALLYSSAGRNEDGSVVRGLSNLTVDDRPRLMRWIVGDQFTTTDLLGGSLLLGGIGVSRNFDLDPYFVRFPTVGLSGAVTTPSTAEVYVNGRLVRSEQLPPGPFQLLNLPASVGAGSAQVVLRDAFGREQQLSTPFYFTSAILSAGVQEFGYGLGFQRVNLATESWDYKELGFLGRHRLGVTDFLTAGLRLEANSEVVSGGGSITAAFLFGVAELAAAASHDQGQTGAAASLGYTYSRGPLSLGATGRFLSDHYANLSLRGTDDRARDEVDTFIGYAFGPRASATVQYSHLDFRDRPSLDTVQAFASVWLTERASLFLGGSHGRQSGRDPVTEGYIGLTYFLGKTTASLSYRRRGSDNIATAEAQKPLPVGPGFGYRVQASTTNGETGSGAALVQYQGAYGRYEASYENVEGNSRTSLGVAGGLVAIGGTLHATRPVSDSFALVRVPAVAGVRTYLNNQEVGRTDARGDVLIPDLLSYYGNRIGIADQDIPIDYSVRATEQTVASPFRGGAVVEFPVKPVRAVIGRVLVEAAGVQTPPAFGQLTVVAESQSFESPIGRDGEFYLDDLPAGRHPAVVSHPTLACSFTLEVPAGGPPAINLGTLRCTAPGKNTP